MRRLRAPVAGALLVAMALACATALAAGTERDVAALEQAIRQNHPAPFHATSEADFEAAFASVAARARALDDDAFLVELMRTVALLGERDGHSGIHPLHTGHRRPMHLLPLKLYLFPDGYWVVAEAGPYGLVGKRLLAVDGIPIDRIEARVRPLVSRDNEWSLRARLPEYVLVTEVLHGLGLTPDAGARRLTFADAAGAEQQVTLQPLPAPEFLSVLTPQFGHFVYGLPRRATPLTLAKKHLPRYLATLDGGRTVYLAYNQVSGYTGTLADRLLKLARRKVTRRIVVDVRHNPGGDNTTYGPLVRALGSRRIPRRVAIYALIGRDVFSAAGNFVAELDRRTRTVFAGEPSGGAPNQWGDSTATRLPDSGWEVSVAPQYVVAVPGDERTTVAPEIAVAWTAADFFAGRDPVLAAVKAR